MLTHQTYPSVNQYTESQKKAVHRILESLEKGEERLGSHYRSDRTHARQKCHGIVDLITESMDGKKVAFKAYMGDVSSSGMSFIYPKELPSPDIIVGIPLNHTDKPLFRGKIVRMREIPGEEFYEYGVKFNGRIV